MSDKVTEEMTNMSPLEFLLKVKNEEWTLFDNGGECWEVHFHSGVKAMLRRCTPSIHSPQKGSDEN